jgi:hypothetical protein
LTVAKLRIHAIPGEMAPFQKRLAEFIATDSDLSVALRPRAEELHQLLQGLFGPIPNTSESTGGMTLTAAPSSTTPGASPVLKTALGLVAVAEQFHRHGIERDELQSEDYEKSIERRAEIKGSLKELDTEIINVTGTLREIPHRIAASQNLRKSLDVLRMEPPADLIVLINPASEALATAQMEQIWKEGHIGSRIVRENKGADRPWVVSITSEADWATRTAFPLGTTTFLGRSRGLSSPAEKILLKHTAPHLEKLWTHKATVTNGVLHLEEKRKTRAPLWVVNADARQISGHNDIWNPQFRQLVQDIIKRTRALE